MPQQRRRARTRRTRAGTRLKTIDRLLIAGCVAGGVYLATIYLAHVHGEVAVLLGVLGGGFALGRVTRLPHLRSPIAWRKGRR